MHSRQHLQLASAFVLALPVLWQLGCANVGQKFPTDPVADIRNQETTQKEIMEWFGSPWRIGVEDGLTTWTYGRYRYSLFGGTKSTDLVIRFDSSGVVVSYTFSTTEYDEDV